MIREMTINDVDQLVAIDKENNTDPWDQNMFLKTLNDPSMYLRVYDDNGVILGYIACKWSFTLCYIANICVKRKCQGVGKQLYAQLVEDCHYSDYIKYIGGEVRVSNTVNRRLSKFFGAVELRILPGFYPDGEDGVKMKVVLK